LGNAGSVGSGSKADLFVELLERGVSDCGAQNERIAATAAGADGLRELIVTAAADAGAEPGWAQLLVEFRAHAARDPELNQRYAEAHARTVRGIATVLGRIHESAGLAPALRADLRDGGRGLRWCPPRCSSGGRCLRYVGAGWSWRD